MSWLARSITDATAAATAATDDGDSHSPPVHDDVEERERGVKHDLTEFRQTLTRQLRDVGDLFATVNSESTRSDSPDFSISGDDNDDSSSVYARISSAVSDHSEIGGFYPDTSRIHDNNPNLDQLGFRNVEYIVEDENGGCDDDVDVESLVKVAVGLTDEVLTFAGNIAHHPETWLDFHVEDDEDLEDFPMSESQKKHAQAIEHLTPRLGALRFELCPVHMSDGFFWKVYFVLLHSRLNKHDAQLLSTPQIVEARTKWMQELHKQDKKEAQHHYDDFTPRSLQNEHSDTLSSAGADSDCEKKHPNTSGKISEEKGLCPTNNKDNVIAPVFKGCVVNFDDNNDDDWPEEDCNATIIQVGIDDEVSFSDLEDDDWSIPVKPRSQVKG